MKLDPGIHVVKHLVFFGKQGVTVVQVDAIARTKGGGIKPSKSRRSPYSIKHGLQVGVLLELL
jgi:hypothetical protein